MVQSVTNFTQQAIVAPLQQRGEQQQQQTVQRQQDQDTKVSGQPAQSTQTRRTGTEFAQSQQSNANTRQASPAQISVSDVRSNLNLSENEAPPRGSLLDISA